MRDYKIWCENRFVYLISPCVLSLALVQFKIIATLELADNVLGTSELCTITIEIRTKITQNTMHTVKFINNTQNATKLFGCSIFGSEGFFFFFTLLSRSRWIIHKSWAYGLKKNSLHFLNICTRKTNKQNKTK